MEGKQDTAEWLRKKTNTAEELVALQLVALQLVAFVTSWRPWISTSYSRVVRGCFDLSPCLALAPAELSTLPHFKIPGCSWVKNYPIPRDSLPEVQNVFSWIMVKEIFYNSRMAYLSIVSRIWHPRTAL